MVCMQLYVKDNESTPGASAAASIFSRYMNVQGFESLKLGESKVYLRSSIFCFTLLFFFYIRILFLNILSFVGSYLEIMCMEGLNGQFL